MKSTIFVAALCIGVGAIASGDTSAPSTQTETKYVMIDGEVIRYDAGKVIVLRGTDNKEVIYTLAPAVVVPADVQIGRRVTLYTEPATNGGTQLVSRVTTTSVTAAGNVKQTTEDTRTLSTSTATTHTHTTNTSGKVEAYRAGKTLTILRSDGTKKTYRLNKDSKVPADLVIGKSVSILHVTTHAQKPVAQTITYVTTTTTETVHQP